MSQPLPTPVNARDWQEGPADAPVTLWNTAIFSAATAGKRITS